MKEQSERFLQKANELTAKKIHLEQNIINLRQDSLGKKKMKLEPIASESSSTDFGEDIRKKKQMLKDAKEKLLYSISSESIKFGSIVSPGWR